MGRAFHLQPDQIYWSKRNSIEATHARMLPGIRCQNCGAWAVTGIIYPSVDIGAFGNFSVPTDPSPMTVEEFKTLAAAIQPVLGQERPAKPGAELGPLKGTAKGTFGDFAWVNPWTPLLRESVWLALKEVGIQSVGVSVCIP